MLRSTRVAPVGVRSLGAKMTPVRPTLEARAQNRTTEIQNKPLDKLITDDHNVVRDLFKQYDKASSPEAKQQLAYNVIQELSIHSSKEEDSVYPVWGKIFGSEVQDHLLGEHQELKNKLNELSGMNINDDEKAFNEKVKVVRQVFEQHAKEEEEKELPRLLNAQGVDAYELGVEFQKAADHAVTRPHPLAPNKPPVSVAARVLTKPIDDIADKIRFGDKAPNDS